MPGIAGGDTGPAAAAAGRPAVGGYGAQFSIGRPRRWVTVPSPSCHPPGSELKLALLSDSISQSHLTLTTLMDPNFLVIW